MAKQLKIFASGEWASGARMAGGGACQFFIIVVVS